MSLQPSEINSLVSAGESETLELKTSVPTPDTIASHLAAFANTKGGTLLIGIKEPATFVGIKPDRAKYAISTALKKVSPNIEAESGIVQVGGANVAYVKVKKAASLVASSGGYYARYGSSIRPLTADEIKSSSLSNATIEKSLSDLSANSVKQAETIDKMSEELRKANSVPRKIGIAIVGAVLGTIAKHLLDIFA
ncbi:ATP-binding protein [Pseudoxanthomonas sp. USHLN014]|uniref:AlbA family DNA-binding domain-containing protein n=1 Tax=Pseudoxanthomonas sp. USHLN014 TaxID=3081297 RepID=UPI00301B837B